MNTYLGQKGYSILKSELSVEEQIKIREELNVGAYMPKSIVQQAKFPVYRESPQKMYIPRYYGIKNYGKPVTSKIKDGDDIDLPFKGELRDYQINIVNTFMKSVDNDNGGGLLEVPCGRGKTICALNIISKIKKKTLVIVHKGFLLNQWIERIEQFLPNAKIGKIQGQVIDIEDKDIVIGMLQSLSMKDYPCEMFSSFGLTVVDEVHHIAAEVFVRSLFKIVTPCVLGLSATMQRKDGLTKVFKMFLGDIIYKEKRDGNDKVIVKAYTFLTSDEDFNEVKYDYRGNPAYSTMISKLCTYNPRNEYIIKIIVDTLNQNENQQLMILAHNKNLLTYFYKGLEHRGYDSIGYYVGGMKEKDLKISETKKIIIATYAMASEALDIKTLTTLVMATPKTDVTQSIGRILRTKHIQPLVVDIVDNHDLFQNQWNKRLTYYMKENYQVYHSDSRNYGKEKYETLYEPGQKKQIKPKKDPLKGKCLIKIPGVNC
jgi:superfamily II DNA or RNA helicase